MLRAIQLLSSPWGILYHQLDCQINRVRIGCARSGITFEAAPPRNSPLKKLTDEVSMPIKFRVAFYRCTSVDPQFEMTPNQMCKTFLQYPHKPPYSINRCLPHILPKRAVERARHAQSCFLSSSRAYLLESAAGAGMTSRNLALILRF